jgi:hypothetical protein
MSVRKLINVGFEVSTAVSLKIAVFWDIVPCSLVDLQQCSRLLARHNIKSVGLPPKKIPNFLRPVKDDLGLKTPDVYSVPCGCSKVYTGQTSHSIVTIIKEHQCHIWLGLPEKSAVAKHCFNLGHHIQLQDTSTLSTKSRYVD